MVIKMAMMMMVKWFNGDGMRMKMVMMVIITRVMTVMITRVMMVMG